MDIFIISLLFVVALLAQVVDIVLGMGFGTIMTPLLIEMGYSPMVVLPVVLLLQAIAGFMAGFMHHFYENINFLNKKNLKVSSIFISMGVLGAIG
ncbi:TSUP family transporter, partial [Candidatus Woesearchaeota archaeon]|nr:TSUP family transporter [Candidatus Woesearchaeota archaeon]